MQIAPYLQRIGYDGPTTPDLATLQALHECHMRSTPFENLDIHLKRPIVLDEARLYDKIVGDQRGGFCYELNAAFAMLLRALGYDVTLVSARVWNGQAFGPAFDHMALIVQLDEPWLADVGFGDSSLRPLRFAPDVTQSDGLRDYRLIAGGDEWIMQERDRETGDWTHGYTFTTAPRKLDDYAEMCDYQQTSPDSGFTRRLICSRASGTGRISLSGARLIVTTGARRDEHRLSSAGEIQVALAQYFNIALTTEDIHMMYASIGLSLTS
ncbi:MAG: arylamine N-acetyltransferase [Anaerolineae bacterium]|nr:arylamine N-acetyltransferase [Anaerolineae bacterium]